MSAIDWYRGNWTKLAPVLAASLGGILALRGHRMSRSQQLSLASLATLGAHQTEEHLYPGYFGGVFNQELSHSDQPRNYPVNANSGMIVNTGGQLFMALPLIFRKSKAVALSQALFGFVEAGLHIVAEPLITSVPTSPGPSRQACCGYRWESRRSVNCAATAKASQPARSPVGSRSRPASPWAVYFFPKNSGRIATAPTCWRSTKSGSPTGTPPGSRACPPRHEGPTDERTGRRLP